MSYIKVKDNNHLLRNTESNCIVNTNKSEYEKYLKLREPKQRLLPEWEDGSIGGLGAKVDQDDPSHL